MNTEVTQDTTSINSTGARLRAARKKMGLTQQNVAERLRLKLSIVRSIEEDNYPIDLASTFLRGYIRSYARLVQISEEDLLPILTKQALTCAEKNKPIQKYSIRKQNKKRDGWLIIFTYLVIFITISLTGIWWWQNHKATQVNSVSFPNLNGDRKNNNPPISKNNSCNFDSKIQNLSTGSIESNTSLTENNTNSISRSTVITPPSMPDIENVNNQKIISLKQEKRNMIPVTENNTSLIPTRNDNIRSLSTENNTIVLNFNADCWLEVSDSTNKKLFSGMQHNGGKLILSGIAPYHLIIGVPSAVQIRYQGQRIDLNHFIRSNQVANLILGSQ